MLGAYSRDVLKPFAMTRTTSPGDTPISRWQFQTTFPYYPPHATMQIVKTAIGRFGGGIPAVWRPGAVLLRSYQLGGGYTPGPLLGVQLGFRPGCRAARGGPWSPLPPSPACCSSPRRRPGTISDLFEFSGGPAFALVTLAPVRSDHHHHPLDPTRQCPGWRGAARS